MRKIKYVRTSIKQNIHIIYCISTYFCSKPAHSVKIVATIICSILLCNLSTAQHFRGMSVVSDKIVWLSGSKGTVIRTINGGESWDTLNPKGYSRKDFRDVHAWNANEALIMSSGDSSVFLKTSDGGQSWRLVYSNNSRRIFFDALDFKGAKGIAAADPLPLNQNPNNNSIGTKTFYFVRSSDVGEHWEWIGNIISPVDSSEAMFAASGSVVQLAETGSAKFYFLFVTSGNHPRLLNSQGQCISYLPILQGLGCGPYSFFEGKKGVICCVGGNYVLPAKRDSTSIYSLDSGKTWKLSKSMPMGYRSCVCADDKNTVWACTGTNGSDISYDHGQTWFPTKIKGYNVCAFSKKYLWLAGNKGSWYKIKKTKIR